MYNGTYAVGAMMFTSPLLPGTAYTAVIMVNTSFTNSPPILLSLYNSAVLRGVEGRSSNASFTAGYMPFAKQGGSAAREESWLR